MTKNIVESPRPQPETDVGLRDQLIAELNHRVKNSLSTSLSIAQQTIKTARTPEEFVERLTGRLQALGDAHNVLNGRSWECALLEELVQRTLAPHAGRATFAGPGVSVAYPVALTLRLMLHELVSNAQLHGALSGVTGSVAVTWEFRADANGRLSVHLIWRESNGPTVGDPARRGFGTTLLEKIANWDLNAAAELRYEPDGLVYELVIPCSERVYPTPVPEVSETGCVEFREVTEETI